jgi:hypothetical protein
MRKDCRNMDGVIEQFDAVTSMTQIGDRFDQDNFYPATGLFGGTLKKAMAAKQKRKATQANAQLAASKGLAKGGNNSDILSILAPTKSTKVVSKGMSTQTKVLIGVGIAAVLGIAAYFILKNKNK